MNFIQKHLGFLIFLAIITPMAAFTSWSWWAWGASIIATLLLGVIIGGLESFITKFIERRKKKKEVETIASGKGQLKRFIRIDVTIEPNGNEHNTDIEFKTDMPSELAYQFLTRAAASCMDEMNAKAVKNKRKNKRKK